MTKKQKKKQLHAELTVYNFDTMTLAEVEEVRTWLLLKIDELRVANPLDYASKYRSRLFK